ncbi:MAG: hypothetical protein KDI46_03070 [Alphaproteobacteria bacterium]|nr:hypothetical protein [Alphaproteobacteria bacterium]
MSVIAFRIEGATAQELAEIDNILGQIFGDTISFEHGQDASVILVRRNPTYEVQNAATYALNPYQYRCGDTSAAHAVLDAIADGAHIEEKRIGVSLG